MSIKTISRMMIVFGLIMIFWGVGMDTTHGGVYNIGLIAQQNNTLMLGGVGFIAGVILFALQKLKQTNAEKLAEQESSELRKKQAAETANEIKNTVSNSIKAILSRDNFARRLALGIVAAGCYIFFISTIQWFLSGAYQHEWYILYGCLYLIPPMTIYYAFRQSPVLTLATHLLALNIVLFTAASIPAALILNDIYNHSANTNSDLMMTLIEIFSLFFILPSTVSCVLIWRIMRSVEQSQETGDGNRP